MGLFGGGFDPLKELQKAADTAGKAAGDVANAIGDAAAEAARNVGEAAGSAAGAVAEGVSVAGEQFASSDIGKAAAGAAGAIGQTATGAVDAISHAAEEVAQSDAGKAVAAVVGAAGAAIAETANNAKETLERKVAERLDAEKAEYAPAMESALASISGTLANEYISSFGESPLPMTVGNAAQVKSAFPIPREQTVLWADAEFDLRPSGIALTEKGVYIKTDAEPIVLPGSKEQTQSRLFYFEWEYFDSSSFTEEGDDNLAMGVHELCRQCFMEGCSRIPSKYAKYNIEDLAISLETDERNIQLEASAGSAAAATNSPQEVFVEQRAAAHSPSGHGELAEEANNLIDKLQGHQAEILGRDNAKNGADRRVDGVLIQTKYHKTARSSLESCFDPTTHQYRYISENGQPMKLEVPKDQYQDVLRSFEEKIRQGKVPGVSDPKEARNIVHEGKLTYQQAVNLTKPGTLESVAYDAATGIVTCSFAFGLSFLAASYMSYRETEDMGDAVQAGLASGIQVFGLSFVQHVVASQLSRTGLANTLMAPVQAIVGKLGHEASATIVNGLRALTGKSAISGMAASKQLAKMLRSNAVTAAVTMAVFSVPETYNLIQGKATGAQYAQNLASIAASIAGGLAGAAAAGAAAAKVAGAAGTAVAPGVGTAVGVAGGMVGGMAASVAAGAVGNVLYEGDGATFGRYFNAMVSCMSVEYMLDEEEMDMLVKKLNDVKSSDFKALIEATLPAENQEEKVRDFLVPLFEEIVSDREHFAAPTDDQIVDALEELEEESEG